MFLQLTRLPAGLLMLAMIAEPLVAQQTSQPMPSSRRARPVPARQAQPGGSIRLTVSDQPEAVEGPRKLQFPVDAKPAATAAEEIGNAQQLTAETIVPRVAASQIVQESESFVPAASAPESVLSSEPIEQPATPEGLVRSEQLEEPAQTEQREQRNDPFEDEYQTTAESQSGTDNAASVIPPTQKIESEPTSRVSLVPIMSLETIGPQQIVVNEIANYNMTIRNLGETIAENVSLILKLPVDVQLVKSSQQPSYDNKGDVRIDLGSVKPNEDKNLIVQLKSNHRGDFQIGTRIVFSSGGEVAVNVTQPRLAIACDGPQTLKYGESREYRLKITNVGDGIAQNVIVRCALPEGMSSVQNDTFLAEIGSLHEGQAVEVVVPVTAATTGDVKLEFDVAGDQGLQTSTVAEVTILKPELNAEIQGPDVVFLDREAVYGITVRNPSQLSVTAVRVKLMIPAGMHVTSIDQQAQYDSVERSLLWSFAEIESGGKVSVHLKAEATGEGRQIQEVAVTADGGVMSEVAHDTTVISRSDVSIVISDNATPVKVGEAATFTVTLANKGTKAADAVLINVELPQGLEPVKSSSYVVDGHILRYEIFDLAADQTVALQFNAVGSITGEQVVRASLKHDGSKRELIAEESVFFYEPVQKRVASRPR